MPYNAPSWLVDRVIQQESAGNPNARSPVGAMGLMQVMPGTAKSPGFGISPLENPWNPEANKRFGTQYLGAMLDRYGNDTEASLAAYNWGPGNADKWVEAGKPPDMLPQETQNYIAQIMGQGKRRRPPVYQPQPEIQAGTGDRAQPPTPTAPAPSQDGRGVDLPGRPSKTDMAMAQALMQGAQQDARNTRGTGLGLAGALAQQAAGAYMSGQYEDEQQQRDAALGEAFSGAQSRGDLVNTMLQSGDEGLRNAALTSMLERPKDSRTKEVKNYEYYRRQAASRGEKPMSFPEWRKQGDTGDLTTDQKNYRFYVRQTRAQGEKPKSFTDWQAETEERKASARSRGKATGEEQANQPKAAAKGERMLNSIDAALRDPALEYVTGPLESWLPNLGANAQRAQSRLDQIRGQTFLQAYQDLKGGGQITEIEGSKAEDALARINTQGMSDEDYRQALTDLREVVVKGLQRARGESVEGDDLPTPTTPEEAAQLPSGTRFRTPDGRIKVTP